MLCCRPNRPHYESCPSICLSVHLSICPEWAPNSKTKKAQKNQTWCEILQGRSNRLANFLSKVRVEAEMGLVLRIRDILDAL